MTLSRSQAYIASNPRIDLLGSRVQRFKKARRRSSTCALICISLSCTLRLTPMSVLATSVATLTAVTWSYLVLARGSFWRLKSARADASDKAGFSGGIVAVVPARNEAELIGPVVTSLLNATQIPNQTALQPEYDRSCHRTLKTRGDRPLHPPQKMRTTQLPRTNILLGVPLVESVGSRRFRHVSAKS